VVPGHPAELSASGLHAGDHGGLRRGEGPNADAWVALQAFLALPQVDVIDEPPELARHWRQLGAIEQSAPKRWMDAYLAAFAIAGRLLLISLDRDFSSFERQGLTLQLLLADGSGGEVA